MSRPILSVPIAVMLFILCFFEAPIGVACPCFNADDLYFSFRTKPNMYCTNVLLNDTLLGMNTGIYTVMLRSEDGFALAELVVGENAGGMFGAAAYGRCQLMLNEQPIRRVYASPITDQKSCTQSILDACGMLNVQVR